MTFFPVLPVWAWLGIVWLLACACLTLGLSRWFRYLSEQDKHERWGNF